MQRMSQMRDDRSRTSKSDSVAPPIRFFLILPTLGARLQPCRQPPPNTPGHVKLRGEPVLENHFASLIHLCLHVLLCALCVALWYQRGVRKEEFAPFGFRLLIRRFVLVVRQPRDRTV